MSASDNRNDEPATIFDDDSSIAELFYYAVLDFLADICLEETDAPVQLKFWIAVAQALADASGYRIFYKDT